LLCECPDNVLDSMEKYYIERYNTYQDGYNLTVGGQDSTTKLNLDERNVIDMYLGGFSIKDICETLGCCEVPVSNILHKHNIAIRHNNNIQNILGSGCQFQIGDGAKPVRLHELDMHFDSLKNCAQWLIDNGYSKASSMDLARKSLSRALHKNKTYCKLHFSYE